MMDYDDQFIVRNGSVGLRLLIHQQHQHHQQQTNK
jgi:hypothetical protein